MFRSTSPTNSVSPFFGSSSSSRGARMNRCFFTSSPFIFSAPRTVTPLSHTLPSTRAPTRLRPARKGQARSRSRSATGPARHGGCSYRPARGRTVAPNPHPGRTGNWSARARRSWRLPGGGCRRASRRGGSAPFSSARLRSIAPATVASVPASPCAKLVPEKSARRTSAPSRIRPGSSRRPLNAHPLSDSGPSMRRPAKSRGASNRQLSRLSGHASFA